MQLISPHVSPVGPWLPLPFFTNYEISQNRHVRQLDGTPVRMASHPTTGEPRVRLVDAAGGKANYYTVAWLWELANTTSPNELFAKELEMRREVVLKRIMAKVLSLYDVDTFAAEMRPTERLGLLRLISSLLSRSPAKGRSASRESREWSIDAMRKLVVSEEEFEEELPVEEQA